jgi:hypothetical protein
MKAVSSNVKVDGSSLATGITGLGSGAALHHAPVKPMRIKAVFSNVKGGSSLATGNTGSRTGATSMFLSTGTTAIGTGAVSPSLLCSSSPLVSSISGRAGLLAGRP